MKLKWLYRKLRKLSLRYGGVVVFFDEADVLGSRGITSGQFDGSEQSAREQLDHLHWLSPATQQLIVDQLRKRYDPRAIRLGLLVNHYRSEWEWDEGLIDRATERLGKWARAAVDSTSVGSRDGKGGHDVLHAVRERLDDDLDAPGAVSAIDEAAARGVDVRLAASLLGVEL
mgnify:CR=1 FL=1